MPRYYFQLGNTPALTVAELEQLLPQPPTVFNGNWAWAELDASFSPQTLQKKAGGVIKILHELDQLSAQTEESLKTRLVSQFAKLKANEDSLTFSLFYPDPTDQPQVGLTALKTALKPHFNHVRYVKGTENGLSAAVLLHQTLEELAVFKLDKKIILARTITVQDIDDWTKRDRKKPYADHSRGMLPPKVARMMVNIALGQLDKTDPKTLTAPLLYDPFCGSGTILMEALLRGFRVQGSDLDLEAVQGAQQNLNWLQEEYQLKTDFSVKQRDATRGFASDIQPWVETIVTEPFLGKQTPSDQELPNIFKGLYRTYLGTMKNWRQILKDGAVVVIITPIVTTPHKVYRLQKLIDNWSDLGYTTISQPIEYSRSGARVKRQINFLRYQSLT